MHLRGFARLSLGLSAAFAAHATSNDLRDPYDRVYVMPEGPHKGKRIDTSSRRPVVILPPERARLYGAKEGEMVIANFFSEGKHWIAKVPDRFLAIIPQVDVFPPGDIPLRTGHTMFRAMTERGHEILLYPQTAPPKSYTELPAPVRIEEMHLSADAVGPPGKKFGARTGLNGELVIALRAIGSPTMAAEKITKLDRKVQQFLAVLPPEIRDRYPHAFLELSNEWGLSKMYHLVLRNCDNVQMCVLDAFAKNPPKFQNAPILKSYIDNQPLLTRESIERRGYETIDLLDYDLEIKRGKSCRSYLEALLKQRPQ